MGMFLRRGAVSTGPKLGDLPLLTIIKLNENGSPIEFYVAKHDYEPDLNGSGRTLLVRKDYYENRVWGTTYGVNAYATSAIDSFFNGVWFGLLDANIKSAIGQTTFYYTPGNGDYTVSTLQRAVFALSLTELGKTATNAKIEGEPLEVASSLQIAAGNYPQTQWTRTPTTSWSGSAFYLTETGTPKDGDVSINYRGCRPAFTLPSNFKITDDMLA